MTYFTAKSYESYKLIGEPYNKNGKLYSKAECKCDRCSGRGIIVARVENNELIPIPVDNGICYKCGGSGMVQKEVRLYTAKEREALDRTRERCSKARETELEARRIEAAAQSENNKKEWFSRNGFSEDGMTWCVFGDDTYAIKEQLKELGCKYSPILKWHSPEPLDVPAGYGMFGIMFDDIMEWDAQAKNAFYKETAKVFVEKRFAEAEGPSLSEYVGQVGERLRNITAVYTSHHGFSGMYGWANIYNFKVGENVLVWISSTTLDIEVGKTIDFTGTVVRHEEYKGVKTTRVNRCKILEVQ